ncbi:MAG: hypothetical protein FWC73_13640 [Defluviitaleaceae bacterium]|nr:hypothetical protein [Defluviitaleaceae bacterium]
MNLLFDFYGSLLTQKQAACFTLRYIDDFSLAEIAQELDISPQAAVDFLKRGIGSLEHYENHLALVNKHQQRQVLTENILTNIASLGQTILHESTTDIIKSLQDIRNSISDISQI